MQLASGCMWIWFADSIPALVGFLRALRFPPTPKNRNPFIFLVNSFWSLVVCIKPACLPEVWLPMCALRLSHSGALRTQWVDMSRVTKTANYNYYYYYYRERSTIKAIIEQCYHCYCWHWNFKVSPYIIWFWITCWWNLNKVVWSKLYKISALLQKMVNPLYKVLMPFWKTLL